MDLKTRCCYSDDDTDSFFLARCVREWKEFAIQLYNRPCWSKKKPTRLNLIDNSFVVPSTASILNYNQATNDAQIISLICFIETLSSAQVNLFLTLDTMECS